MPIKSQCPHCQAVFKVSETYIGQAVVCTKCKNQYQVASPAAPAAPAVTPVTPVPAQPVSAVPAAPVAPVAVDPLAPAAGAGAAAGVSVQSPKRRKGRKGPGFFKGPAGGSPFRSTLWLGLLLFVGTFALKQVAVDYHIVRTNPVTELARVELAQQAEKESVNFQANMLAQEIQAMRLSSNPDQSVIEAKQKELQKLTSANLDKLKKIRAKYSKLRATAQRNATTASATSLWLLKVTWWFKLFLDFAKIAGCFLVLYAAFNIVCDANEGAHVKTFATVCAGITLAAILILGVLTYLS